MRRALSILAAAGLATAALAWQRSVDQLQQDGKTISTSLRVVDGTLMVPAKDVAAYLGGKLSVKNGTATISSPGTTDLPGGTPAQNLPGGVPTQTMPSGLPGMGGFNTNTQPLFPEAKRPSPKEIVVKTNQDADDDGFVLRVLGVENVFKGSYRTQYDPNHRKLSPSQKGDRLVVVRMRLENRTTETRRPPLPTGLDVTLFDESGVGVAALAFDARPVGNPDPDLGSYRDDFANSYDALDAPVLAPKGAFEFAAVFSLPKSAILKRLSVALPPPTESTGGTNVIVSLEP